jgi:hypothetical protein
MRSAFDMAPDPVLALAVDLDALDVEELEPRLEFAGCGCGLSITGSGDMNGGTITFSYYDCGCLQ